MERFELNLHTNMSKMNGITSVSQYIKKAIEYGMTSIAVTDYEVVQAFPEAYRLLGDTNPEMKVIYGMEANIEFENNKIYNSTILVKNKTGLTNLYKLVSFSYLKYYNDKPVIPFNIYKEYSNGLIIGLCFNNGELYNTIINDVSDVELYNIANKYDYLEICPVNEDKRNIVKKIINIGNKANKLVVATGNVYYLEKEDKLYSDILSSANGESVSDNTTLNYFRTTDEMLKEFEYLGKEKSYEVVITNTNKIADMCERIQPIPNEKCYPHIDDDNIIIKELAYKSAYKIYGKPLPKQVEDRLNKELKSIIENGYATLYLIALRLVKKANDDGYIVGNRGSIGSSLVAYCLGITETNPLKYNIPFETFAGFNGDKEPDIDLNFAYEYQKTAQEYVKDILEDSTTFFGGTIGTLAENTAYEYVKKYFNNEIDDSKAEQVVRRIVGTKRITGHHPGGVIVVPKGREIYEFTPVQYAEDEPNIITTHFDYHSIDQNLLKLDILGNHIPSILYKLKELTGIYPTSIPLDDKQTLKMMCSADTTGIPEFETEHARNIILESHPTTFEDLVKIYGLLKGTDVWENNAQDLIKSGTATLSEVITTRDDIMNYLISIGIDDETAFRIMEFVRKGKARRKSCEVWEKYKYIMKNHNILEWYIKSCEKISYLFPRAHAVGYVINYYRMAWYKVHYPNEFYQAIS